MSNFQKMLIFDNSVTAKVIRKLLYFAANLMKKTFMFYILKLNVSVLNCWFSATTSASATSKFKKKLIFDSSITTKVIRGLLYFVANLMTKIIMYCKLKMIL